MSIWDLNSHSTSLFCWFYFKVVVDAPQILIHAYEGLFRRLLPSPLQSFFFISFGLNWVFELFAVLSLMEFVHSNLWKSHICGSMKKSLSILFPPCDFRARCFGFDLVSPGMTLSHVQNRMHKPFSSLFSLSSTYWRLYVGPLIRLRLLFTFWLFLFFHLQTLFFVFVTMLKMMA